MAVATGDSSGTTRTPKPAPQSAQPVSDFVRDLCTTNGGDLDREALRRLTGQTA